MAQEKIRLDELLLRRGLANSISRAQSLILSGSVLINDRMESRSGISVPLDTPIRIREKIKNFVSRGAHKLIGALESFPKANVEGKIAIDLGASTGGFTQILLEKGAIHVFAIDVGYGQLATKLQNDTRVTVRDRFHIKNLSWQDIELKDVHSNEYFITMDLSFMSLRSVFPIFERLHEEKQDSVLEVMALVKPQFEIEDNSLLEKGILNDRIESLRVFRRVAKHARLHGAKILGLANSKLAGADGNREFFMYAVWK
ncbi:MAG: TlyA family RNA methyltransferase [Leptospira sp.]|nr:TlyA family RNA methyltransferase [Leptospira sp.]